MDVGFICDSLWWLLVNRKRRFFFSSAAWRIKDDWCLWRLIWFRFYFSGFMFLFMLKIVPDLDLWGQRICDPGPLYIRAQDPHRGETLPTTWSDSPNGLEIQPRTILSSVSQNLEGKNDTPSKAAPKAFPEEKTSTIELAWGAMWERFKEKLSSSHWMRPQTSWPHWWEKTPE